MATYSEDGTWMWSEEHSKWIPSPPSSNNAIDSTTSTENKNLCKNCGKMIYKGWDKCTSCGVFVDDLLKDTSNTKPFEYEFNNLFQKGNEGVSSSSIKEKIKKRKRRLLFLFEIIFTFSFLGLQMSANRCIRTNCSAGVQNDVEIFGNILLYCVIFWLILFVGILPVSLKHWRYSLPERKDIFKLIFTPWGVIFLVLLIFISLQSVGFI